MHQILLTFLLLAGPIGHFTPDLDLVEPGHRKLHHEVVLDWPESLEGRAFVAFPTRGLHGAVRIERGVPFPCSSKYGTKIYAVPTGAKISDSREDWVDSVWPSAAPPVRFRWSVSASNPLALLRTDVRVVEVRDDGLALERTAEHRLDSRGNPLGSYLWLPLVLVAAVGAGMLFVLDRRRRARPARGAGA